QEDNLEFNAWYAKFIEQKEADVSDLFASKTATNFLMTWSIFETIHFGSFVKVADIQSVSLVIANKSYVDFSSIDTAFKYFHYRYQDKSLKANLLHTQNIKRFEAILGKNEVQATKYEKVEFLIYVVYRYRNNIFHGNKGVSSWLAFDKQITKCVNLMQAMLPELAKNA
ncbi:TPA: hypothetical protein ACQYCW_004596, partial [Vibrio parahaemolyticus]